jgi:hypothetical protein
MATGAVRGLGGIQHVINGTGPAVDASTPNHVDGMQAVARLASYPQ